MFCTQCGSFVDDHENYCRNCGNYVGNTNQDLISDDSSNIGSEIDIDADFSISLSEDENKSVNTESNINTNVNASMNQNMNYNVNPNFNNNMVYKAPVKRTNTAVFVCIGLAIGLFILFIIGGTFLTLVGGYYFSNSSYADGAGEILESVTKGKGKYKTVIVTDNTYSKMEIHSEEDADKLIVADSVEQKGTTSEEIKTIENDIITNYGITAVNLCEMDPAFSREIANVIKKITEEYPSTKGYLTNLSINNASMREQYIAAFLCLFHFADSNTDSTMPWVMKTQVFLNSSYYLNLARLESTVKDGSNAGHFPPNATIYSPIAHEFGHYLSFIAVMKKY